MSTPLPLRVCCMAAMAPALTEAATQARIKLSPGSPPVSSTPSPIVLNGSRDYNKQNGISTNYMSKSDKLIKRKIPVSLIKINKPEKTVAPFATLNDLHDNTALNCIKIIKGSATSSPFTNGHTTTTDHSGTAIKKVSGTCSMNQQNFGFLGTLKNMGMNGKKEKIQTNAPLSPPAQGLGEMRANGSQSAPTNTDDVIIEESEDLEEDLSVLSKEVVNKQNLLNRKSQYLLRRLRRLQGKRIDSHIKQQLAGFLSHQHNTAMSTGKYDSTSNITVNDLKTGLLQSEDMKNLSTAALVSLVRKLQSNQSVPLGQHFLNVPKTEKVGVSLDTETKEMSKRVSGRLLTTFHSVESTIDSDATESSSGGESCDEADDTSSSQSFTSLCRRAGWKWAVDRGAVVSRWTWLQAQVSDLEYRIRQHSDIYKQIRASKGSVLLGESPPASDLLKVNSSVGQKVQGTESSPCNISSVLSNVNHQATKLTQSLGNCLSPLQTSSLFHSYNKSASDSPHSLNGVIGANHAGGDASNSLENSSPGTSSTTSLTFSDSSSVSDLTCQSARCRPVKHFRKRKLLRTAGLHQRGRKAARLSSVKCQCYPPVMPCPMCGGRYNNTQTVDSDMMSITERISLLDPAFHPVLSFTQEIPLSAHFESLLKSGEWQNKPPPRIVRTATDKRKLKALHSVNRTQNKKLQKSAALLSSEKIRIKYENKVLSKTQSHEGRAAQKSRLKAEACLRRTELKKRKAAKLARAALKKYNNRTLSSSFSSKINNNHSHSSNYLLQEFGLLNNSSSSSSFRDLKDAALRKRRESAYDINNIVIPYSIASSTRLEKLQYKEIVTPKWRWLSADEESSVIDVNIDLTEEELEDLSDKAVGERHSVCEAEERKRFTGYHKALQANRGRSSRTDSTASETFSPDISVTDSAVSTASASVSNIPNHQPDTASRRRTFSFSKSSTLSDIDEQWETICEVEPWPPRTFPLTDEDYNEMKAILSPPESVPHSKPVRFSIEPPETPTQLDSPLASQPGSPVASISSNGSFEEDPDDPEWTVREGTSRLSHSSQVKRKS